MTLFDWLDIFIMGLSAISVFLCRYKRRRDAVIGTFLFMVWIYQIYETSLDYRASGPSDVLFDALLLMIIVSTGGNIMSVVADNLPKKIQSLKEHLRSKHENQ